MRAVVLWNCCGPSGRQTLGLCDKRASGRSAIAGRAPGDLSFIGRNLSGFPAGATDDSPARSFPGVRGMNSDTAVVGILLYGIGIIVGWVIPIRYGIRTAKAKGYSPHWMWFGIYPVGGWIAWLILACLARRQQCRNCGGYLASHFRVCPYCSQGVLAAPAFLPPQLANLQVELDTVCPAKSLDHRPLEPVDEFPPRAPASSRMNPVIQVASATVVVLVLCITIVTSLGTSASTTFSRVSPSVAYSITSNSSAVADPDEAARAMIDAGFKLIESENSQEALRLANESIATGFSQPTPYFIRAEVRFRAADYKRAEIDYSSAISMLESRVRTPYWDRILAFCLRGRCTCYFSQDLADRAWIDINKAMTLNPQDSETVNRRGVVRELLYRDFAGALDDYGTAMRMAPQNTSYQANYFRVSRTLGK